MGVPLILHTTAPKDAGPPADPTDEQRAEWVKRMQAELAKAEGQQNFTAEFETEAWMLTLKANRFDTAVVAVCGINDPPEMAAISLFLRGKNSEDDAAALKEFREHPYFDGGSERVQQNPSLQPPAGDGIFCGSGLVRIGTDSRRHDGLSSGDDGRKEGRVRAGKQAGIPGREGIP